MLNIKISEDLKDYKWLGAERIKPIQEDENGFVYITMRKDKLKYKLKKELAKYMVTKEENKGLGSNFEDIKLSTISKTLLVLFNIKYKIPVYRFNSILKMIDNLFAKEEEVNIALELVKLLRDDFDVSPNELPHIGRGLLNVVDNDLNMATRVKWGKGRTELTLEDISNVLKDVDKKTLYNIKKEISDEQRKLIEEQMKNQGQ